MKIKVRPEDFVVEEVVNFPISKSGSYTLLRLQKRYWNTLDVIDFVARKYSLSKERFSRAGLKDRYSLATQYLTFQGVLKDIIKEKNFELIPIGRVKEPISPEWLKGNRFSITIRDLDKNEIEKVIKNFSEVLISGFPNYFDEQRFGSARHQRGFFAKLLMHGHYQGALKLLMCYPYKEDSKNVKVFKNFCAENWGDWSACLKIAPREYRKIIIVLKENPNDYKNAIKQIDREMLNLYLLAYQSYLFNEMLNLMMQEYGKGNVEVPYSMGKYIFYHDLKRFDFIKELHLPIINERTDLSDYPGKLIKKVLDREQISLGDFRLNKMRFRGVRFKAFPRKAIIIPEDFTMSKPEEDDIYKGKKKILINVFLPAGSYATILIKRLLV